MVTRMLKLRLMPCANEEAPVSLFQLHDPLLYSIDNPK